MVLLRAPVHNDVGGGGVCKKACGYDDLGGFSLVWFSLMFDWALFRTINVDQR